MANITLITVGTLKENYLKDAVSEYKKRLSQYARVDEVNTWRSLGICCTTCLHNSLWCRTGYCDKCHAPSC